MFKKSNFTKKVAAIIIAAMCVPATAMAAETPSGATSGSFQTSFDIYSPALTISVPLKLDIQVNPFYDGSATGVDKFEVASNSIDIINGSVDLDNNKGIPVNVAVTATITNSAQKVITSYNTFTASTTSTVKKINLKLTEAGTPAVISTVSGGNAAYNDKKLDLSVYEFTTDAKYDTTGTAGSVPVTKFGSLLSVDIAAPTATVSGGNADFSVASSVTPKVGSFAVTGVANTAADWKANDVTVTVTYKVKASNALGITTPTVSPVTFNSASAADVTITVPNVDGVDVTVVGVGLMNTEEGAYGNVNWDLKKNVTLTYSGGSASIVIPKEDPAMVDLAAKYTGKAQDLLIALSDGRVAVTTFTAN